MKVSFRKPLEQNLKINKIKEKTHRIISMDAERAFDKVQQTFMVKTLNKLGIEGNYLNIIKAIYENTQQTSYSMVKD